MKPRRKREQSELLCPWRVYSRASCIFERAAPAGVACQSNRVKDRRKERKKGGTTRRRIIRVLWSVNNDFLEYKCLREQSAVRFVPCPALPFNLVALPLLISFNRPPFPTPRHCRCNFSFHSFAWTSWKRRSSYLFAKTARRGSISSLNLSFREERVTRRGWHFRFKLTRLEKVDWCC